MPNSDMLPLVDTDLESKVAQHAERRDEGGVKPSGVRNELGDPILETPPGHSHRFGAQLQNLVDDSNWSGHRPDPALLALEKLGKRRIMYRVGIAFSWLAFILMLVLAAAGFYGYQAYKRDVTTGYAVDYRPCSVELDNGIVLTGERSYSYSYNELFGQRWRDNSSVVEKTTLKADATPAVFIEHTGLNWKKTVASQGEMGVVRLGNAEQYTIIKNGGIAVISYHKLCK